jgi:hypothetical protein
MGFWTAEEEYSEAFFGNWFATLARARMAIRLTLDRDQCSVEVGGPSGEWFSTMVWSWYLQGEISSSDTPPLDEQCEFIVRELQPIAAAIDNDPELVERLRHYQTLRAQLRRRNRGRADV